MQSYESIDKTIDLLLVDAYRKGHRPFMVLLDRESFGTFAAGLQKENGGRYPGGRSRHGEMVLIDRGGWYDVPVYSLLPRDDGARTIQVLDLYGRTRYLDVADEVRCTDPAMLARIPRIPPEPGNPAAKGGDEE